MSQTSRTAVTATIMVENPQNGERAMLRVRYSWEDNFGQGGFWIMLIEPSARQVWDWLKCEGCSLTHDWGHDGIDIRIIGWFDLTEGFHPRAEGTRSTEHRLRLGKGRNGGVFFFTYPTWGAVEHDRDFERDEIGLLPEHPDYLLCEEDRAA